MNDLEAHWETRDAKMNFRKNTIFLEMKREIAKNRLKFLKKA